MILKEFRSAKDFKQYQGPSILVKCWQSVCPLRAINWDLRSEDQIIQDGKLAGQCPAWPGCRHFSCFVLSLATNHPSRNGQQQLQFTRIWRMVTSTLNMVKFTANNQYVFSGKEPSFISVIGQSQAEIISFVTWMHSIFNRFIPVAENRALLWLAFSCWSFLNCHLHWFIQDKHEFGGQKRRRREGKKKLYAEEKLFLLSSKQLNLLSLTLSVMLI